MYVPGSVGAQRCVFWEHQREDCLLSLRWCSGELACCDHVLRLSKLFFCLIYLKSLFLLIFFYIREPADRRKDGIMWRERGKETVKCSLEASGGPLEKKSPCSAVPSQPMTTPVRMKQFLWFAFESFSPCTFRVTSACQIPRGGRLLLSSEVTAGQC